MSVKNIEMKGELKKIANGYKSYDISGAEQNHIFEFADILTKQFGFHMIGAPVAGCDGVYWVAFKESIQLTVGWDIWSGAFVMAHCRKGNKYIEDIQNIYKKQK